MNDPVYHKTNKKKMFSFYYNYDHLKIIYIDVVKLKLG